MVASTEDCREFVAGFADALTRIAYLLTVTDDDKQSEALGKAQRRTTAALAHTVRRWHDVAATGAPEPVAIEALVTRLPRRRRVRAAAGQLATGTRETIPDDANVGAEADAGSGADSGADIDIQRLHEAIWLTWVRLTERQRVPFVLADVSPVSRRLDGLGVPDAFASPNRLETLENQAVRAMMAGLAADPCVPFVPTGREFEALLAETLAQHARDAAPPSDPFVSAVEMARRSRRRALAAGTVVVVVVAAVVALSSVSTSRDRGKQLAASAASSASQHARAVLDGAAARKGGAALVNWPTRGTLKDDAALIASVRSAFVTDHIDATGQVQVLLATDTPWFRAVYVTSQTRTGMLRSWYYGPVGAANLVEGFFSYAGPLSTSELVTGAVADTAGHDVLFVLGPPDTTSVELAGAKTSAPLEQLFPVPVNDGLVVDDISGVYVPGLQLRVVAGGATIWDGQVPAVQLAGMFGVDVPPVSTTSTTAAVSPSSPGVAPSAAANDPTIKTVVVERGQPDPKLLDTALAAEHQYVVTGALEATGMPVVVWAGTDSSGVAGVLLRAKTLHLSDLLIAVWANAPGVATAYRLAPDAPDAPIVFQYAGVAGASVGVLAPHGITQVGLVVDGADIGVSQVDSDGFATLLVGQQYGVLAEQTLSVDLFDAKGRQISREPVTPSA